MRSLQKSDFKELKELADNGANYSLITEHLTKKGVTLQRGQPLKSKHVSAFMLKHGYRARPGKKRVVSQDKHTNFGDIQDLLSSNINTPLKISILKTMVRAL